VSFRAHVPTGLCTGAVVFSRAVSFKPSVARTIVVATKTARKLTKIAERMTPYPFWLGELGEKLLSNIIYMVPTAKRIPLVGESSPAFGDDS
jgi:hypothetical protein